MKRPEHSRAMKLYWKKNKKKRLSELQETMSKNSLKVWKYKRAEMLQAALKSVAKARKTCHTPRQRRLARKTAYMMHMLPRTAKQLRAGRENFELALLIGHEQKAYLKGLRKMIRLPRSEKQLIALRKGQALKGSKPSKIQDDFSRLLKKQIPSLRCNDYLIKTCGHQYRPDNVNLKTRKIVEVDGAYWHDEEKDRIRDGHLRKAGWKVLHIPADRKFLFQSSTIRRTIAFLKNPGIHLVSKTKAA
jgi:very-short-patch-repair endonuclease